MTFEFNKAIEILEKTPIVIEALFNGISKDWVMNNEGPDTWSPYEIVGHLIHGEKTDWIPRARIILSGSENRTFLPFDRFAQNKENHTRTIEEMVAEFTQARNENLMVLRSLNISLADLHERGVHPELGAVNLKELLSTWVVHDLGHISQITRVMAKQYKDEVGVWKEYLGILK